MMASMESGPQIRDAADADLAGVLAIYDHEVDIGHATFDLTPADPEVWREKILGDDPFLVAVDAGEVTGFAYATPFRPRPAYHRTKECSVYLRADAQGQGLGPRLYDALLSRLREADVHAVLAVVALPNEPSLALHERFGFEQVGVMREVGDKFDRLIDVALLQRLL